MGSLSLHARGPRDVIARFLDLRPIPTPPRPASECLAPRTHLRLALRPALFATSNLGEEGTLSRYTLSQLRQRYIVEKRALESDVEAALRADCRPGAKAILHAVSRRRSENRAEGQRIRRMMQFERALWAAGTTNVAGVDEAGMSPLAGPVAAAAVILPPECRIPGIDDSKKLDAPSRRHLAREIKAKATAWCVSFVEVDEIDRINIYWAGLLAMRRAVEGLAVAPEHLLLDARRLEELAVPQQAIIKGDTKSACIAAASILAKTARDAIMYELDRRHPGYGFAEHKGYPVRSHYAALTRLGACPVHRRSFAPVREVLGLPPLPPWPRPGKAD
jgi:ribonuclease HII